jgi:hypothetical protein
MGLWAVLHEIRSDYAQILTTAFLLINGPGKWSLDALLFAKRRQGIVAKGARPSSAVELPAATAL